MSSTRLRQVEINGHQEYWKGYFHAWCGLSEHPKAIIETETGEIKIRDATKVKFTDTIGTGSSILM